MNVPTTASQVGSNMVAALLSQCSCSSEGRDTQLETMACLRLGGPHTGARL